MRNAILQIPESRTPNERRQVLRAAIRQLERAEIYLAAVAYMELDDRAAQSALNRLSEDGEILSISKFVQGLRTDLVSLRRHLGEQRSRASD